MDAQIGKLEAALDLLTTYATDDDIPINQAEEVQSVVTEGRAALSDIRTALAEQQEAVGV